MLVQVCDKVYRATFSHDIQQSKSAELFVEGEKITVMIEPTRRSRTYCFINKLDRFPEPKSREEGTLYASASVECSHQDVFNKAKGRKFAMARALAVGGFSREERILFWEAYKKSGAKFN